MDESENLAIQRIEGLLTHISRRLLYIEAEILALQKIKSDPSSFSDYLDLVEKVKADLKKSIAEHHPGWGEYYQKF